VSNPQTRLRQINATIIRLGVERTRLIRELHNDGYSLREIAQIAELSHQTIANILAR